MKLQGGPSATPSAARLPVALALMVVFGGDLASGQNVYRCGPERNVYSQQPCTGGTSVDVRDPRSAAQRAEARTMAAGERKRADQLTHEREMEAAKAHPTLAGAIEPAARTPSRAATAASQPASSVRRTRHISKRRSASAPHGEFAAIVPGSSARQRHLPPSSPTR